VNYSEARMRAAIESFERALQLDPGYALARAGLALALAWFSVRYAYENEALQWGRRADEEAKRALALDPALAEAHLALANAAGTKYGHFDWATVITEADDALKLDPALDLAFAARARALYHLGLFDLAGAAASQAMTINPDSTIEARRLETAVALFSGQFADARSRAEELVKISDAPVVRLYLGQALFYTGERTRAADLLAGIKRGDQPDVRSQAALASVLAAEGRRADAQAIIDRVARGSYMDHHVAYSLGAAYAQLRQPNAALTWLGAAVGDGFTCYPWFERDPMLDPIRGDAGYATLMAILRKGFDAARARYGPTR
jgi:tetratricopeptide (TPR) repeat protein